MVIFNNNGMLRGVFFFYTSSFAFLSWSLIPRMLLTVQGSFWTSPKHPVGPFLISFDGSRKAVSVLRCKAVLDMGKITGGSPRPLQVTGEVIQSCRSPFVVLGLRLFLLKPGSGRVVLGMKIISLWKTVGMGLR